MKKLIYSVVIILIGITITSCVGKKDRDDKEGNGAHDTKKPPPIVAAKVPEVEVLTQDSAQQYITNYVAKYPDATLAGKISFDAVEALYTQMKNNGNCDLYYVFGRCINKTTKNEYDRVMLFNTFTDPKNFGNSVKVSSYIPFCPSDCNSEKQIFDWLNYTPPTQITKNKK